MDERMVSELPASQRVKLWDLRQRYERGEFKPKEERHEGV